MYKTVGVLAHVDAGKTTFSEQLLYHTNSIRERGRVDHQNTYLDHHTIERERGITVFAEQGMMTYKDRNYYLIDTPGHVDFSPEMERAIQVMDYAIVIISAVDGVEGHTETVWQLLRKHRIPTFIFLNKIDREGFDIETIRQEISSTLSENVCDITNAFQGDHMDETLVEWVAERDEVLLERYMETGYDKEIWLTALKRMIHDNEVFPCATGSALKDIGVMDFFEKLDLLTETTYKTNTPFSARVYKIRHDEQNQRITFLKALSGTLKVRDLVSYGEREEKVTQLRLYNGVKYVTVQEVSAGMIFAVAGLTEAAIGDGIGALQEKAVYECTPTLKSKVVFDKSIHVKEVLRYFQLLDAEDPSLRVIWNEEVQEIHVHVMGVIQLEVLEQIVRGRFSLNVTFGDPQIVYKETIDTLVYGYGHFEPLKHYAEVHLKIEPAKRGTGLSIENACHADALQTGHQNLVRHHLLERDHHGLLTGSAVTDLKITLLTGRAHNEHTSGGDFREATYRALRQGLEQTNNVLLEPFYDCKIKVDMDHMGRVMADLQKAYGRFEPPEIQGTRATIKGRVPVATFMNYSTIFASYTNGKGALTLSFGGYEHCHNPQEVIEAMGYDKNADPAYSSSSIFCAKGKGYSVSWEKAEAAMHCEIVKR